MELAISLSALAPAEVTATMIWFGLNELPGKAAKADGLFCRKLVQEGDVPAIGVTELGERVDQDIEIFPLLLSIRRVPKDTNDRNMPGLLCPRDSSR
jgi:hypothetical protein